MDDRRKEMHKRALKLFAQCDHAISHFEDTGKRVAFQAWQDQCKAFEEEFRDELTKAKLSILNSYNKPEVFRKLQAYCTEPHTNPPTTDEGYFDPIALKNINSAELTKEDMEDAICAKLQQLGVGYTHKIPRVRWWQVWRWHLTLAHRRESQRQRMKFFTTFKNPTSLVGKDAIETAEDFRTMFENFGIPARISWYDPGRTPLGYVYKYVSLRLPRYLDEEQRAEIYRIVTNHKDILISINFCYTLFWWQSGSKVVKAVITNDNTL